MILDSSISEGALTASASGKLADINPIFNYFEVPKV